MTHACMHAYIELKSNTLFSAFDFDFRSEVIEYRKRKFSKTLYGSLVFIVVTIKFYGLSFVFDGQIDQNVDRKIYQMKLFLR